MPKRLSTKKRSDSDVNTLAKNLVEEIIELTERDESVEPVKKNPAAVSLGRLGGLKGGKARAAKLSSEERSDIARKAANARWSKTEE